MAVDIKSSLILNPTSQVVEKGVVAPKSSPVSVYKAQGFKPDSNETTSDWAIARAAFDKFKKAGMDRADIRNVLKGLGYTLEAVEGEAVVKRESNYEGELRVSESMVIDAQWRRFNPDKLLNDPEALKQLENLTISKSLALRDGVMGLVTIRDLLRSVEEETEELEINVLIKNSSSKLPKSSQDKLE